MSYSYCVLDKDEDDSMEEDEVIEQVEQNVDQDTQNNGITIRSGLEIGLNEPTF